MAISDARVLPVTALRKLSSGKSNGVTLERAGQIKMRMPALAPSRENTSGSAGWSDCSEAGSLWRSNRRATRHRAALAQRSGASAGMLARRWDRPLFRR